MRIPEGSRRKTKECDLQGALCTNIEKLERGLKFVSKESIVKYGKESNPGRIDITAEDAGGATVVIEVKMGKAGRRAVGQILGYMGVLMQHKAPVRGILIAKKFSPQAEAAARAVPTLKLRELRSLPPKFLIIR